MWTEDVPETFIANRETGIVHIMDDVYMKSQAIRYIGDKSNANTDSVLVATKRSLIFNELNKELNRKFFMTKDELKACKDGYIYIHDQSARLNTVNCSLFDLGAVMKNGFEMGNVWSNEPSSLDTAFDVINWTHNFCIWQNGSYIITGH